MKPDLQHKEQWLPYALVIIMAALFVHNSTYYVQPDIDGGMVWAVNDFFSFRQTDAFFYPHTNGPLNILKLPTEQSYHLLASTIFNFSIRVILGFFLLQLAELEKKNKWTAFLVFTFFLASLNFDFIIIATIVAGSFYFIKKPSVYKYIPISILIAISIYVKGSVSFPSLFVFGSMLTILFFHKEYKQLLQLIGLQLIVTFILSAILYQNPFDGISWVFHAMLGTLSYGSNQAIYFNNFLPFLIPAFLFAVSAPLIIKHKDYRILYGLTILLVIIFWKYVLGREDFTHYRAWYFLCFMLVGFSLFLLEGKTKIKATTFYFLSFLFFMSNVKRGDSPKQLKVNTPSISSFASAILKPAQAKKIFAQQSDVWSHHKILSDTLLQIIGQNTVDAYPWELSIIRKYKLNYHPRVNFFSTLIGAQADKSDSAHFAGTNSPQFIIWHNSQASDYQLNAHNKIYLLNANPRGAFSIQKKYDLLHYENGYALWQKKSQLNNTAVVPNHKSQNIEMNEWFTPPNFDSSNVVYGHTNFSLPFSDKIRNVIYKGRFFKILYKLKDKEVITHFISLESLQNNFIIQPYFTNPRLDHKIVETIKIQPLAEKFEAKPLKLTYYNKYTL